MAGTAQFYECPPSLVCPKHVGGFQEKIYSFHCPHFSMKWSSWCHDFLSFFFLKQNGFKIKCLLIVKHVKYWCLVRTGKKFILKGADGTPWGEDDVVNLPSLLCA